MISPLLANIYLDPLDRLMAERGYRMVRYADDFVILCRSREEADAALELVRGWVADNGLTLHPTKTHVGGRAEGARFQRDRQPGQGFEFVMPKACVPHDGYRFEDGRRHVRQNSMDKLRDTIRGKTGRNRGDSLACIIADLNRTLAGWFAYFKHARPRELQTIDAFIRRRLRALLLKQKTGQSHIGIGLGLSRLWPNAVFAKAGLFALDTAWKDARQSR